MRIPSFALSTFAVVLVLYLLIVGEALMLPLVIAIALWYLINTLAAAFARIQIGGFQFPSLVCLLASLLTFVLLIWGLINFLSGRADDVLQVIPIYQENLTERLQNLPLVVVSAFQDQLITDWIDLPAYATSVAASFAGILASGGLIMIYILFLFLEQGNFDQKITALFSSSGSEEDVRKIITRIRNDIQKYISIKMFTSSVTGLLSYIFLRIVDVDFAGVWGLLIFLLNFIPTVGSIIATIFWDVTRPSSSQRSILINSYISCTASSIPNPSNMGPFFSYRVTRIFGSFNGKLKISYSWRKTVRVRNVTSPNFKYNIPSSAPLPGMHIVGIIIFVHIFDPHFYCE